MLCEVKFKNQISTWETPTKPINSYISIRNQLPNCQYLVIVFRGIVNEEMITENWKRLDLNVYSYLIKPKFLRKNIRSGEVLKTSIDNIILIFFHMTT